MFCISFLPALALLLPVAAFAQAEPPAAEPPVAKTVAFSESLYGEEISDPYRWMEAQDAEYQAWLKAEGDYARQWLDALPGHTELLEATKARSGEQASLGTLQAKGGKLFLPRRTAGAEYTRLFVRDEKGGEERLILDPAQFDTAAAKGNAINYWEASPDGKYVYFGVSPGGSEQATLHVLDVATGKLLPGQVPLALFNVISTKYPQWLPDSSGFFYNRLAEGATPGSQEFFLNTRAFFHRIDSDFGQDVLIMQAGHDQNVALGPIDAPLVITSPGSTIAVLTISNGVAPEQVLYTAPLSQAITGKAQWVQVSTAADKVVGGGLKGNDLYLLLRDKPRGRVVKTSAIKPSLATATEIVPESDIVISSLPIARNGIYVMGRDTKGTAIRLLGADGRLTPVALPFSGQSNSQFAIPTVDGMFIMLENSVTPRRIFSVSGTNVTDTGLAPKAAFPTDIYASEAVEVTARDGTKVPLDIFYRKDTPRDGKRAVILNAYGAYGIENDAPFLPAFTSLLDTGAVIGVAHVRGGGELGDEWWLAGQKTTKPNTWRDAIDSAEYMIENGWTTKGRISIYGGSAGGIMVGGAVTERPDLWAAGIAQVGVLNALRAEFSPNGIANVPEFGSVETKEGFEALKAMDAYYHVKDGTAYPPMLLTAGLNDPRVVPWQPAKFAARMQAATTGGPVIFMVNTDQGHGIGSSRSQAAEESADLGAFALWAAARADAGEAETGQKSEPQ